MILTDILTQREIRRIARISLALQQALCEAYEKGFRRAYILGRMEQRAVERLGHLPGWLKRGMATYLWALERWALRPESGSWTIEDFGQQEQEGTACEG